MEVKGEDEVRKAIEAVKKSYPKGFAGALYKFGIAILGRALPLTPVEFAVLRSSGYVSPPSTSGTDAVVEVGYGTVYAVYQHEMTGLHHPRGGQAKFLDHAIRLESTNALERIAKWAEELQKSGRGFAQGPFPTAPKISTSNPRGRKNNRSKERLANAARRVKRRLR